MSLNVNINLSEELSKQLLEVSNNSGVCLEELLVDYLNQKVFYKNNLKHGFYTREGMLYDAKDNLVCLTKIEYHLLSLFMVKRNRIVTFDEIQKKIWKEKSMSIYSLRNIIRSIRQKTYDTIIYSSSKKGYIMPL